MHSFDKFYIVTKFILPSIGDLKFSKLNDDNTCTYFYVRQYTLYGMSRGEFTAYIYMCSLCTAIHNYPSSGSLFFATLRQNN